MAYACRKRGVPLAVYAGTTANALKLERMRALGGAGRLAREDFDAAKSEARRAAQESGVRFVEDGLDVETLEGAGTIRLGWLRSPESLDALLVPLGNGALFSGVARVMKARSPKTRVIAVQAAGAPAMIESWREGRVVVPDQIDTIGDGIGVRVPIPQAVEDMRGLVDDAVLVTEGAIVRGMRLLHQHTGIVAEPSAAVGIAALLEHPRVIALTCRGNRVGRVRGTSRPSRLSVACF